jgi:hydrogenase expression/formation protein HypC
MCLGIPMQIVAIDGYNARCTSKGVMREVSLFMLQDESIAVNDYVIVHVGYAIQKMTEQEARSTWELLDELVAAEAGTFNPIGIEDDLKP